MIELKSSHFNDDPHTLKRRKTIDFFFFFFCYCYFSLLLFFLFVCCFSFVGSSSFSLCILLFDRFRFVRFALKGIQPKISHSMSRRASNFYRSKFFRFLMLIFFSFRFTYVFPHSIRSVVSRILNTTARIGRMCMRTFMKIHCTHIWPTTTRFFHVCVTAVSSTASNFEQKKIETKERAM